MSEEIRVKHECCSCHGTGLYSGMGESERAAVVCHSCKGHGWQESVFQPFTGRKEKPGVIRVYRANPGIKIGEGRGHRLEDFGGMPLEDWKAGKPFPDGSEMRDFTCPRWWCQTVGGPMPEWDECWKCLGRRFSDCANFNDKGDCWKKWDAEKAAKNLK